jgi:hypothetical protein
MLIVLSESLRTRDLRAPLAPPVRDALLNLSTAAYEGKHLLAGTRLLFGDLQQLPALGPVTAGRFKEASTVTAEALALRDSVTALIRVEPVGSTPSFEHLTTATGVAQFVFHLPLDHFADSARVGSSCLVGEHLRDVTTYIALAEAVAVRSPYRGLRCTLRAVDGHGGETHQTFLLSTEQEGAVLCIVDSDRADASSPLGSTATKLLSCCDGVWVRDKAAVVHVLPCRELENLLPAKLVLDAVPTDPKDTLRNQVVSQQHRLGLADFAELKHLVKLPQISEHLRKLTPMKRAEAYFSEPIPPALREVSTLAWSFGLAPRRGRT